MRTLTLYRDSAQSDLIIRRIAPALVSLLVTIVVLLPSVLEKPWNGDESGYVWSAAYYGAKIAHFDFSRDGTDPFTDPGWSPYSGWVTAEPMGARYTYMIAMALSGTSPPAQPYDWSRQDEPQPNAAVPPNTLLAVRVASILLAALAFALMALRWGWRMTMAAAIVLTFGFVRNDLILARAESQAILGLALCATTFRTRWFPVSCAIAATFKLTGLAAWPLLLWPAASGWKRLPVTGPAITALVLWSLFNPASLFVLGAIVMIPMMAIDRVVEFGISAKKVGIEALGVPIYAPTRYLLPFLLPAVFAVCGVLPECRRLYLSRRRAKYDKAR